MGSLLYEAGSSITEHGLSSCDAKSLFVVLGWAVMFMCLQQVLYRNDSLGSWYVRVWGFILSDLLRYNLHASATFQS